VAVPDPGGKGRSGPPEASPDGQAQRGLVPTRGGTGPPGGSEPVEAIPEHPVLGHVEAPDLYEHAGGGECQTRGYGTVYIA
jgi:hypothetical protein